MDVVYLFNHINSPWLPRMVTTNRRDTSDPGWLYVSVDACVCFSLSCLAYNLLSSKKNRKFISKFIFHQNFCLCCKEKSCSNSIGSGRKAALGYFQVEHLVDLHCKGEAGDISRNTLPCLPGIYQGYVLGC